MPTMLYTADYHRRGRVLIECAYSHLATDRAGLAALDRSHAAAGELPEARVQSTNPAVLSLARAAIVSSHHVQTDPALDRILAG